MNMLCNLFTGCDALTDGFRSASRRRRHGSRPRRSREQAAQTKQPSTTDAPVPVRPCLLPSSKTRRRAKPKTCLSTSRAVVIGGNCILTGVSGHRGRRALRNKPICDIRELSSAVGTRRAERAPNRPHLPSLGPQQRRPPDEPDHARPSPALSRRGRSCVYRAQELPDGTSSNVTPAGASFLSRGSLA